MKQFEDGQALWLVCCDLPSSQPALAPVFFSLSCPCTLSSGAERPLQKRVCTLGTLEDSAQTQLCLFTHTGSSHQRAHNLSSCKLPGALTKSQGQPSTWARANARGSRLAAPWGSECSLGHPSVPTAHTGAGSSHCCLVPICTRPEVVLARELCAPRKKAPAWDGPSELSPEHLWPCPCLY